MAELLKITVKKYSDFPIEIKSQFLDLSEDAVSSKGEHEYLICYNDEIAPKTRSRFTILHEIGHIQLGHLDENSSKSDSQKEKEANYFAKYLIAPLAKIHSLGLKSPEEIAFVFNISRKCAENIYENYTKVFQSKDLARKIMNGRLNKLLIKYAAPNLDGQQQPNISKSLISTMWSLLDHAELDDFPC